MTHLFVKSSQRTFTFTFLHTAPFTQTAIFYGLKIYLSLFKLSENPKYELRIFGIAVFICGSRSMTLGCGDKLNPEIVVAQQLNRINITIVR